MARTRPRKRGRDIELAACGDTSQRVVRPTLAIRINREKSARIVEERRIDSGNKIAAAAAPEAVVSVKMTASPGLNLPTWGGKCGKRAASALTGPCAVREPVSRVVRMANASAGRSANSAPGSGNEVGDDCSRGLGRE